MKITIFLLVLLYSHQLFAISCNDSHGEITHDVVNAYLDADAVLLAQTKKVEVIKDIEFSSFSIMKKWKGTVKENFNIQSELNNNCCFFFKENQEYLMYLYKIDNHSKDYYASICSRTKLHKKVLNDEVLILDNIEHYIEKYQHKLNIEKSTIPLFFDVGFQNIFDLQQKQNLSKFNSIIHCDSYKDWSKTYCFSNKSNNSQMLIDIDIDDGKPLITELSLSQNRHTTIPKNHIVIENFTSNKGIKLGMPINKIIELIGQPSKKSTYKSTTNLLYTISNNQKLLQHYGLSSYTAEYIFENKYLIQLNYSFSYQ